MPRSPTTFTLPPGTTPQQPNTVISSAMFNAFADDVAQTFNTVQPIVYGGTGSTNLILNDADFGIKDNSDQTKIGQFNSSGLPTATTRTYDLPYYSGTLGLVSDIIGYIRGLTLTNSAGDLTNDIAFAAGSAVDSTGAASMLLASGLIKQVDATWVAGTNQGGRFYTTLVDGTIYSYVIRNPTTGVVDSGFSDNATNPTGGASYPSGFTQYALVGKYARVSGVNKAPRMVSVDTTDWVAYTPTFTGFGTVTNIAMFSRRVGDSLQVRGSFTTGTTTAVEARISLGFGGVDGSVVASSTNIPVPQLVGSLALGYAAAITITVLCNGALAYLTFGRQDGVTSGLTNALANSPFANATKFSLTAEIPIQGW